MTVYEEMKSLVSEVADKVRGGERVSVWDEWWRNHHGTRGTLIPENNRFHLVVESRDYNRNPIHMRVEVYSLDDLETFLFRGDPEPIQVHHVYREPEC